MLMGTETIEVGTVTADGTGMVAAKVAHRGTSPARCRRPSTPEHNRADGIRIRTSTSTSTSSITLSLCQCTLSRRLSYNHNHNRRLILSHTSNPTHARVGMRRPRILPHRRSWPSNIRNRTLNSNTRAQSIGRTRTPARARHPARTQSTPEHSPTLSIRSRAYTETEESTVLATQTFRMGTGLPYQYPLCLYNTPPPPRHAS